MDTFPLASPLPDAAVEDVLERVSPDFLGDLTERGVNAHITHTAHAAVLDFVVERGLFPAWLLKEVIERLTACANEELAMRQDPDMTGATWEQQREDYNHQRMDWRREEVV